MRATVGAAGKQHVACAAPAPMNAHFAKGDGTSGRFWSWRVRTLPRPLPAGQMREAAANRGGAAGGGRVGKKGRATGCRLRLLRGDGGVAHEVSRLTGCDRCG